MSEAIVHSFRQILEETLKHYPDLDWLGEISPLATPYFLGEHLAPETTTLRGRGRALQKLLTAATAAITGKYAERYQTILREYYVQGRPAAVVWDQIGLTKNSFHLNRNAAIDALEAVLVAQLQPALRLEQPPLPTPLVERERPLDHTCSLLTTPKMVALIGPGGIGKTALAAQAAADSGRPLFWYTVRPGLNDQVESLVFALALFAHRQGSSTLWAALATQPRQSIDERVLSALRYALTQIQPLPLLCIDALELLQPATLAAHQAFVHCLESLRGLTPLLLLGQQLPLDADEYIPLVGLSPAGVSLLLLEQQGRAPLTLRAEFHALTQGNPRLLKLCLAALAVGETDTDLQRALATAPALDLLFSQIVLRLPERERQILMALSVLRSPAPAHNWQQGTTADALTNLVAQGFVQTDRHGGLDLPLVYRQLLLHHLDEATSRQLHQQAAVLRSQTGAYTEAAYHLVEAGQPEAALALWREYGAQEIAQGQAATALALFQHVQRLTLAPAAHEQATLICAQLQHLTGQPSLAATTLSSLLGKTPILTVEAAELTGMIANDRSEFDNAAAAFARALRVAEGLIEVRLAHVHKGRAWLHLRQRELAQAEQVLGYAQVEIETMRGNLALDQGAYEQAALHYLSALQVAEVLAAPEAIGKCCNNLGGVALFQGRFAEAIHHLNGAVAAYERIGKVAAQAGCRITLAVAHNQAGAHRQALAVLKEAEDLLVLRSEPLPWQQALIAQARAEAYLGLGDWPATATHVQAAIAAEEVSILPDAYRVYGELCLSQGDYAQAERWLRQSVELAHTNGDGYLAAYAQRKLGVLYQAMGKDEAATHAVAAAMRFFEEANLPHEIERTRQEVGHFCQL